MTGSKLKDAYAACRAIAKREAKNFYYAFRVLPQHKSDAMCAVYAFMRKADDLADDDAMSLPERREAMAAWTSEWRASRTGDTDDPVFLALKDTQRRFGISDELLEQLVAGTTLDLREVTGGIVVYRDTTISGEGKGTKSLQIYETFDDLYQYCYLVASVVGLVCIRIFGYSDPRAEKLAEETGIAFQLTNIVRDIKEDMQRGRIYLPLEDLQRVGIEVEHLSRAALEYDTPTSALQLVGLEIARAEAYYRAGYELISLIDPDSREAMRILVTIYHELLKLIASDPGVVFKKRVSVPTWKKVVILLGGSMKTYFRRLPQ